MGWRSSPWLVLVALVALGSITGCGPTNYKEVCEDSLNALCRQLYRCRPDEARAVWPNIQDCADSLFHSVPSCSSPDAKSCRVDPYLSSACIDDVDNLECSQDLKFPSSCERLACL